MAQLIIYIDATLKGKIEEVARDNDRSISYVVRQWIEQGLEKVTLQDSSGVGKSSLPKHLADRQASDPHHL